MDFNGDNLTVYNSTRLDRYPAKMVSRLANKLVDRFAADATRVLDPFSGSGAILVAAHRKGIEATGIDLNPIAAIFSHVKLNGFSQSASTQLAERLIKKAASSKRRLEIQWSAKHYWFTPTTIDKFERLRRVLEEEDLQSSNEGMAILLSFVLSIRLCSRADQRSPKPFISKDAIQARKGKHFDPYRTCMDLLGELAKLYSNVSSDGRSGFFLADISRSPSINKKIGKYSHIITSPPYINAQDYFRNFKLELHLLESLLPFNACNIQHNFVGTERGDLLESVTPNVIEENYRMLPLLNNLEKSHPRLSAVVHRYFSDMGLAFDSLKKCLLPDGKFVLVCGDNLIGGLRVRTWQLLTAMLEQRGFKLYDTFSDKIGDRMLAPKRCGHKGIIKEEVVCAFQLS